MPSTREPIQLLEPSDLLEPLDLRDNHANSVYALAYPEYGGTANSASARTSTRGSAPAPVRPGSRGLKSALIVAGALACFGAGAALSQFPNLPSVGGDSSPTMAEAIPPAPRADATIKPDAQQAAASNQPERAATPSAPQQSAAPTAKESTAPAAPACDAQGSPKDDSHCLAGATVQPAAARAKPTAASDPVPLNAPAATQPVAQAETPAAVDRARADTRPSGEKQQRVQSSRGSRRTATRRDAIDQRSIADNNVPSVRWSFRRQGGDADRASGDRRDWATDDSRATAYSAERWQDRDVSRWQERDNDRRQDRDTGRWQDRDAGRWQDRDSDRAYGSRRDRYDAYSRGDDRGGARAWREDDRMNGRPPQEAQPMFAPFRSGW